MGNKIFNCFIGVLIIFGICFVFWAVCFAGSVSNTHNEAGSPASGSVVYALDFGTTYEYAGNFGTTTTDANGDWSIYGFATGNTVEVIITDPSETYKAIVDTMIAE